MHTNDAFTNICIEYLCCIVYKLSYESVRGLAGLYILSDSYAPQEDPESQHTLICITLSFV